MCDTCGCGQTEGIKFKKPGEDQGHVHSHYHEHDGIFHTHEHSHADDHEHDHDLDPHHPHGHDHSHSHGREINLELDIMQKNSLVAERNRGYFEAKGITAFNLVSSPGSGKTTILERTIREAGKEFAFYVVEGDQQTTLDAERIDRTGAPVLQVNTGNGCHLDAQMVNTAVKKLEIKDHSILMIENVGNLVCPALFDLGESKRVVIISVTEGEDKPLKYPNMFQTSHLCLINKSDLLPYLDFDLEKFKEYALRINKDLQFITLSAKTGEGLPEWIDWLSKESNC
jgi:hydrogenase nickel incorporation protein HypB